MIALEEGFSRGNYIFIMRKISFTIKDPRLLWQISDLLL